MPPGTEGVLNSSILENAGLFGALMLFMIAITVIFLWYLWRRDKDWQAFVTRLWQRMDSRLQIEGERRRDAMEHGMSDVKELSDAIREQSRQIGMMSQAIARHDSAATSRHGQIMGELGVIKEGVSGTFRDRMMQIVRDATKRVESGGPAEDRRRSFIQPETVGHHQEAKRQ